MGAIRGDSRDRLTHSPGRTAGMLRNDERFDYGLLISRCQCSARLIDPINTAPKIPIGCTVRQGRQERLHHRHVPAAGSQRRQRRVEPQRRTLGRPGAA